MLAARKGSHRTSDRRHMDRDGESAGQSRKSYLFRKEEQYTGS